MQDKRETAWSTRRWTLQVTFVSMALTAQQTGERNQECRIKWFYSQFSMANPLCWNLEMIKHEFARENSSRKGLNGYTTQHTHKSRNRLKWLKRDRWFATEKLFYRVALHRAQLHGCTSEQRRHQSVIEANWTKRKIKCVLQMKILLLPISDN